MTEGMEETSIILVARQVDLKPSTQHHVTVTGKACGLRIIDSRTLARSSQSTLASREIKKISPNQSFYILFSTFSGRKIRLPTDVKITQTKGPPSIIHDIYTDDREASPIGTPKASTNLTLNVPDRNVNMQNSQQTDV